MADPLGDLIVGSGPSGVSLAHALLARGRKVTMIDGGARLETDKDALRAELASCAPQDWPAGLLDRYKAGQFGGEPGSIRRFGSGFAILDGARTFAADGGVGLRASHAAGGLSNFWGSAVLPNRQADIANWPVSAEELAPHYRAVAGFMPIAASPGALDAALPAFVPDADKGLPPSPQGAALMKRLTAREADLRKDGLIWGQARQAVAQECKLCGLCLHGCPWGFIFNADQAVAALRAEARFTYLPGQVVRSIADSAEAATVHLQDGQEQRAERVYLASGVLETARLVLTSFRDLAPDLALKDSQHMFTPMLHSWSAGADPATAQAHALTEVFLEMEIPQLAPTLFHSQLYTWNEFYAREMVAKYGKLPGLGAVFSRLAKRLIVAQTFLHSDLSSTIRLTLAPDGRLNARHEPNAAMEPAMTVVRARLAKLMRRVGLYALTFAGHAGAPGSSFHAGSTLPMSRSADALTDPAGRLRGTARVHVVDASVLPSIPATTITFSVMANAHRIGSIAP